MAFGNTSHINKNIIFSIVIISLGAIISGYEDLDANYLGYIFIFMNNTFTGLSLELTNYINKTKNINALGK